MLADTPRPLGRPDAAEAGGCRFLDMLNGLVRRRRKRDR